MLERPKWSAPDAVGPITALGVADGLVAEVPTPSIDLARVGRLVALAVCAGHTVAIVYGLILSGTYVLFSLYSAAMLAAGVGILFQLKRAIHNFDATGRLRANIRGGTAPRAN